MFIYSWFWIRNEVNQNPLKDDQKLDDDVMNG